MTQAICDNELYDVLHHALLMRCGKENGLSIKALRHELLQIYKCAASEREIRSAIKRLRMGGAPICGSTSHGYYYATCFEDVEETCAFLESRAFSSLKQIAAMRRVTLPRLLNQLSLENYDQ